MRSCVFIQSKKGNQSLLKSFKNKNVISVTLVGSFWESKKSNDFSDLADLVSMLSTLPWLPVRTRLSETGRVVPTDSRASLKVV